MSEILHWYRELAFYGQTVLALAVLGHLALASALVRYRREPSRGNAGVVRMVAGLTIVAVLGSALIAQLIGWRIALSPVCLDGAYWPTMYRTAFEEISLSAEVAFFASIVPAIAWLASVLRERRAPPRD